MPIIGRSHPLPAIISRSDPADFATVQNPNAYVVTPRYAGRRGVATLAVVSRSDPADFATAAVPSGYVVTPVNKTQLVWPAIISQAPSIQVSAPASATPTPLVVVPPAPVGRPTAIIVTRGSLEDASTPQPIVAVPVSKRALLAPPIVVRSSLADEPVVPTGITAPPVVSAAQARPRTAVFIVSVAPLGGVECDCKVHRPVSGTTLRPGSTATARPSSGTTLRPCSCA